MKKCNYCGFVSSVGTTEALQASYVAALIQEIELTIQTNNLCGEHVKTIFFGGGTPTVLSTHYLSNILDAIAKHYDVSTLKEVSIEVNPAIDIDFGLLKAMGFNRLSIGTQSFNDVELQFLGRLHDAQTAEETIKNAHNYFDNISLDLIYGIPFQTISMFESSLNKAINTGVSHISAYSMTFETGTKLYQMVEDNQCQPVNEDTEFAMYNMLCDTLSQHHIYQYEVSNFAAVGLECQHNKVYWERDNYIGFGVAAHSLLYNKRWANTNDISLYIKQLSIGSLPYYNTEVLTETQIFEEKIFLGLRSNGLKKCLLNAKQSNFMQNCVKMGYACETNDMFVLTNAGRFITDSIVLKLI